MAVKGWPDYTRVTGLVDNYDEFGENYPVGMGDGAARLGSIKTYDMRGRVWWMDDFEASVLHWDTISGGTGGSQALSDEYVRNGCQSLKLVTATGAGRASSVERYFPLMKEKRIGMEFHVSVPTNARRIRLTGYLHDGTNQTMASVLIDEENDQIKYRDESGWDINTGFDTGFTGEPSHFHDVKFVFDYATDEWVRILYDAQELDLTGIAMQVTGSSTARCLYCMIEAPGDGTVNVPVYVDDVIFTIMEPE